MNVKIYRYVWKVKFEKMKPQAVVQSIFTFFPILLLTSYRTFNMHYQDAVRGFLSSNAGVIIRLVKINMDFLWLSLIRKRTDYVSFKTLGYIFDYRFCSIRLFILKSATYTPPLKCFCLYIFFLFSSFMCVFQRICSSILYICAF